MEGIQHGLPFDVVENPIPSMPSMEKKVFVGSKSIIDLTIRATQFVPARVESAPNPKHRNFFRDVSNTQMFSCLCNQQRRLFVIQQHLHVFVGVACEPTC